MTYDPALKTHRDWIGLLQPVGVVVSPPALLAAQALVDENLTGLRDEFDAILLPPRDREGERHTSPALPLHINRFERLAERVLGWNTETDLVPLKELPDTLRVPLPEYQTELAPSYAVPVAPDSEDPAKGNPGRWLALINVLPRDHDLDRPSGSAHGPDAWHASPHSRFERLLRETQVPLGLLFNESSLRVVYQPVGEASGHVTFPFALLAQPQGAIALGALKMLLSADRLFSVAPKQRLPAILVASRRYQNEVSETLSAQVLDALWELLAGFRSADAAAKGRLLGELVSAQPEGIYAGLLTVLLRLIFVLKAEDQGMLPNHPVYLQGYSVRGLFESLRDDAGRYADAMDLRVHAWGRLIALFRLIHDGGGHGELRLPPRYGELFDPDAHPFLEGRPLGSRRVAGETLDHPRVSDGVVYRVLAKLMVLDGEALSYRTLDVEQLGGVYESLMGFAVKRVEGTSVALTPDDVVVDLDALLAVKRERAKQLAAIVGKKLPPELAKSLDAAKSVAELVSSLGRRISSRTPTPLPPGALVLHPTEERRRSGSHYTPRALTEPIVKTTLDPVLEALSGASPTPAQILGIKVCDPAMGSGAFLVAACRYLGDALVRAWGVHGAPSGADAIPPDEDEVLHARRLVAQHCLYGVDRNPFAVSLAKLSLWLVTMAKDHPFTFLDPVLRHGDSLVGLSRDQLGAFHWSVDSAKGVQFDLLLSGALSRAVSLRTEIQARASSDDTAEKSRLHRDAEHSLADARMLGDLVVESFFAEAKDKARAARLKERHAQVLAWQQGKLPRAELAGVAEGMREGERGVFPFHWPLAFPEVFARENPGFDAIVGNPPYGGKNTIASGNHDAYIPWLQVTHSESHGAADLIAHFFRRSFDLLREGGTLGLIATNTLSQGDTRASGLRWICQHGGTIYNATRRHKWDGMAAVVVSVVHIRRGEWFREIVLDGNPVEAISAFLQQGTIHDDPPTLLANHGKSFKGVEISSLGFLFDDHPSSIPTNMLNPIRDALRHDASRILRPYLGGEDINSSPTITAPRTVVDVDGMTEHEFRKLAPILAATLEAKVVPDLQSRGLPTDRWWNFRRPSLELKATASRLHSLLAVARVSKTCAFELIPSNIVANEKIVLFASNSTAFFAVMQSRVHEFWARFFSSTLKDDLQYTPSDCFETFPFPAGWETNAALEALGRDYHALRAGIMVARDEGLTKTYNRFHDPDEDGEDILRLREMHDAMDRAVLAAYGWSELRPVCAFVDEHPDDEEDAEESGTRKKKRAVRYRWPDAERDAVLAKLLALNAERAKEEKKQRELAAQTAKVAKRLKG